MQIMQLLPIILFAWVIDTINILDLSTLKDYLEEMSNDLLNLLP